jgi:hypothetical protein
VKGARGSGNEGERQLERVSIEIGSNSQAAASPIQSWKGDALLVFAAVAARIPASARIRDLAKTENSQLPSSTTNTLSVLVCYSKSALDRIGREQLSPSNSKTAR